MAPNTWFHFAFTLSAGTVALYVDGASVATSASLIVSTPSGAAYLGSYPSPPDGNTEWLTGDVDEVTVYNRALSAAEIASIHAAGSAGKCHG